LTTQCPQNRNVRLHVDTRKQEIFIFYFWLLAAARKFTSCPKMHPTPMGRWRLFLNYIISRVLLFWENPIWDSAKRSLQADTS